MRATIAYITGFLIRSTGALVALSNVSKSIKVIELLNPVLAGRANISYRSDSTCVDCVSGTNTRYKDDTLQPPASEKSADSHRTTDLASNGESHTNPNVETKAKQLDTAHRSVEDNPASSSTPEREDHPLPKHKPLRPLTSVKWPYIPEESSYPDPLKRDDPKPLSLAQYEAIGKYVRSHN